jgi:hypothetical protein
MLSVTGIMVLLVAMMAPALKDITSQAGRKGAVNILLNTFEQARVAALEMSVPVYVGFADAGMPESGLGQANQEYPYRRFIVFRERIAGIDTNPTGTFVPITKWEKLPDGVSFKSGLGTIADSRSGGTIALEQTDGFPSVRGRYDLPVLKFNRMGIIEMPGSANLWLFIYEGFYSNGNDVFVRAAGGREQGLFERISFARYTGRAQLDITTIPRS